MLITLKCSITHTWSLYAIRWSWSGRDNCTCSDIHVACHGTASRGELSYLAPLGSENISAPYFKQWVKHHASQSQDRNNKYFILYIEFCINNNI